MVSSVPTYLLSVSKISLLTFRHCSALPVAVKKRKKRKRKITEGKLGEGKDLFDLRRFFFLHPVHPH